MVSDWQSLMRSSNQGRDWVAHYMPFRKHQAAIEVRIQMGSSRQVKHLTTMEEEQLVLS